MSAARQRLRLRYRKDDVLMWIGHLDVMRLVIRLLHSTGFPFATSGKFSPKPRITFGPPLALGVSAEAELLDLELQDGLAWNLEQIDQARLKLAAAAQPRDFAAGLTELAPDAPPISRSATHGRYLLHLAGGADRARRLIEQGALHIAGRSGEPVPAARGIKRLQAEADSLLLDGAVSGTEVFNIMRLVRGLEAAGYTIDRRHRLGLLDQDGILL